MKYPYGTKSQQRLASCDPRLVRVFERAADFWDIAIIEGHRSSRRQSSLFMAGKTKVRRSKHNEDPSLAVDAAPHPIDWDDTERFYRFGWGVVGLGASMGIKLRWGGDWDGDGDTSDQSFNDLVHFEVVDGD